MRALRAVPTTTSTHSTRLISLRGIAAAGLVFAGAVHLLLAVSRSPGWRAEAVGFAAVGIAQLLVAVWFMIADTRAAYMAVTGVAIVPLLAWAYTRAIGYPFGPWEGQTLEVHGLEVLVAIGEVVPAMIAIAALASGSRLIGAPGFRIDTLGPVLVVLAGIPGMVGIEAVDNYLVEPDGRTHTHDSAELVETFVELVSEA